MIQSDKELDKFIEDKPLSKSENHNWQITYALRNNQSIPDWIIEEEKC